MTTSCNTIHSCQPPCCPNPNCPYHNRLIEGWRFKKIGFFSRRCSPQRIQRFLCLHCRRSFSCQTFSTTYYLKRPELLPALMTKTCGGMANRQIARDLRAAPSAIDRQLARLGRHCLLFHQRLLKDYRPTGDVVIDGFESFEYSQYFPIHHHLAVEADSSFFIWFTDSEMRRKGRMRPEQRRRRGELEGNLGRPDPKAIEKDMAELLQVVVGDLSAAVIRSDEHPAYPRAIGRVQGCRIEQRTTSSELRRDFGNPLFEVNLLDMLVRHSQANHRRETIAWSKRRQGSAERLAILLVWRNYVKYRWEKRCRQTPGMLAGLTASPLGPKEILKERIFRSQVELPGRWSTYYDRAVQTRALPVNRRHELTYAR